jgi:predicted secreted protein
MAGKTSTLYNHPGQVIIIELPENGSTGYVWQIESASEVLKIDSSYTPADAATRSPRPATAPEGPLIGGGGIRQFQVSAPSPGRRDLVLVHSRPWLVEEPLERREYDIVTEPAEPSI